MNGNLKAQMALHEVGIDDIQRVIGKTRRSAKDKVEGKSTFTLSEAISIRDNLFPECSLDFLFVQPNVS